mgnify:CR=1 FL=1
MEELRSIEVLDKEIQADARKKAEKILEKAEVDCDLLISGVSDLAEKAKTEILKKNDDKATAFEKDQKAAVPLEKERFKVSYIQNSINAAFNGYFENLSDEKILEILFKYGEKYADVAKSKKMNVFYYGFPEKAVKNSIEKKYSVLSYSETEFNKMIVENNEGLSAPKGVILESDDKSVRIRLTVSELISQIQDKYRAELFDALFGGRLDAE